MQVESNTLTSSVKISKKLWLTLIATNLFTFMSTLDGTIVNIAMPSITQNLHIKMNEAAWITSSYTVIISILLILFGKIGDSFGKIRLFQIGSVIFTVGSALCGFSNSLSFLLIARAIQAIGAAMYMANNFGIIAEHFPISKRGMALGITGTFVSLGSIAGPSFGGFLIAHFSWHSIFWVNIPVGVFAFTLGLLVYPKEEIQFRKESIDKLGFSLFALFMISLFLGIFTGQDIGFSKPSVLVLFATALLSFFFFIQLEIRSENPFLDLKLFKNHTFSIGILCGFLIFSTNMFNSVIMPFYLIRARGFNSMHAGITMMGVPIAMMIASPICGYLADKYSAEILSALGLIIVTISQMFYMTVDLHTTIWHLVVFFVFTGLGVSLFQSPNNTIVMSNVPKQHMGIAGSLNALARNSGMVVGIALSTTVLFQMMSFKAGYHITDFINNKPDIFIYGMQKAYMFSFSICLFATLVSVFRLLKRKKA